MYGHVVNLTGRRFSRLLVISYAGPNRHQKATWLCRCDCGQEKIVVACSLVNGLTRSCGCLLSEVSKRRASRHGLHGSREYRSWKAMRQRCANPKTAGWKNYGGRGIRVCGRWNSFENFLADMGECPEGCSIDRIDNNGNYEPGNCRWATRAEQRANCRPWGSGR